MNRDVTVTWTGALPRPWPGVPINAPLVLQGTVSLKDGVLVSRGVPRSTWGVRRRLLLGDLEVADLDKDNDVIELIRRHGIILRQFSVLTGLSLAREGTGDA